MSVVAGCSLFDGVLLAADARATVRHGSVTHHADNVQKLFAIGPHQALGFVGDIPLAGKLISGFLAVARPRKRRRRYHPVRFTETFARYLRYAYRKEVGSRRPAIGFMLAGVLPDRRNVVERQRVVDIIERFRLGQLSRQRNWMPGIVMEILIQTPPTATHVVVPGVRGILSVLRSPDFIPRFVPPLGFTAIGSGEDAVTEMDRSLDHIFAADVGNAAFEAHALREAVADFVDSETFRQSSAAGSVGGLYPVIHVGRSGCSLHGHSATIPFDGPTYELRPEAGSWVQRNSATGKEIRLIPPWRADFSNPASFETFDDMRDALRRFRGLEN